MKKLLTLLLVLAMCLGLAVPALAITWDSNFAASEVPDTVIVPLKAGDTVVTDSDGYTYRFSNPVIGEISNFQVFMEEEAYTVEETYYQVPLGTVVTLEAPDGTPSTFYAVTGVDWGGLLNSSTFTVDREQIFRVKRQGEPAACLYLVGVESTPAVGFTDVKQDDWFYEAVQWAVEQNITTGTTATTFSPADTCTQAQILTFLWRAKGSPEPKTAPASSEYYAKAAQWAKEQNIIDNFDPNTPCTRALTVEFLWKAAGKPQSGNKTAFGDIQTGTDLESAVAWAVQAGVTTGTSSTTFSPDQICNRGQIVTFLYRASAK